MATSETRKLDIYSTIHAAAGKERYGPQPSNRRRASV